MTLAGRRVVVTGTGGIGAATARRARAAGARLHLVDADPAALAALTDELGASGTVADLTDAAATEAAFAAAAAALGGLDGLVAVAGGSGRRYGDGPVGELTAEGARRTLELNALPPLFALGAFVRRAHAPASAVLVGSVLAGHPHPDFATHAYAFAKAGIEGLTRAAAARYAREGVRVNAVAPGLTRTPMAARAQADPAVREWARGKQPLTIDGFVEPDEVASGIVWLLASRQITGQVIAIDGGWGVC